MLSLAYGCKLLSVFFLPNVDRIVRYRSREPVVLLSDIDSFTDSHAKNVLNPYSVLKNV